MYVNIKEAQDNGLNITIENRGKGDSHLIIQPIYGEDLSAMYREIRATLRAALNFSDREAEDVTEEMAEKVHMMAIWRALKDLDRSEP